MSAPDASSTSRRPSLRESAPPFPGGRCSCSMPFGQAIIVLAMRPKRSLSPSSAKLPEMLLQPPLPEPALGPKLTRCFPCAGAPAHGFQFLQRGGNPPRARRFRPAIGYDAARRSSGHSPLPGRDSIDPCTLTNSAWPGSGLRPADRWSRAPCSAPPSPPAASCRPRKESSSRVVSCRAPPAKQGAAVRPAA